MSQNDILLRNIAAELAETYLKSTTTGSLRDYLTQEMNQNRFGFSMVRKPSTLKKGETQQPLFIVEMPSNKIKFEGSGYAWYRNRNIPSITVMRCDKSLKNEECRNFSFYISACFSDLNNLSQTEIKGENFKKGKTAMFDSLKFEKTSYILNGSLLRLLVLIMDEDNKLFEVHLSNLIYVTSWKNYLQDKPSKSAIFQPFLPSHFNRVQVVQEGKQVKFREGSTLNSIIEVIDNISGLSDYFKGSTIKQKICHPLFLAILFSKTVNLYYSQDLHPDNSPPQDPSFKKKLLIYIQKYFVECLVSRSERSWKKKVALEIKSTPKCSGMDEKVRSFLQNIFDDSVVLISKQSMEDNFMSEFNLFPDQTHSHEWMEAYKSAFSELEIMILRAQNNKLLQKQMMFYKQESKCTKEIDRVQLSSTLYQIPKVEITLCKQYVDPRVRILVPVGNNSQGKNAIKANISTITPKKLEIKQSQEMSSSSAQCLESLKKKRKSNSQKDTDFNEENDEPKLSKQIKKSFKSSFNQDGLSSHSSAGDDPAAFTSSQATLSNSNMNAKHKHQLNPHHQTTPHLDSKPIIDFSVPQMQSQEKNESSSKDYQTQTSNQVNTNNSQSSAYNLLATYQSSPPPLQSLFQNPVLLPQSTLTYYHQSFPSTLQSYSQPFAINSQQINNSFDSFSKYNYLLSGNQLFQQNTLISQQLNIPQGRIQQQQTIPVIIQMIQTPSQAMFCQSNYPTSNGQL